MANRCLGVNTHKAMFGGNYHLAVYNVTADRAAELGTDAKLDLIDVEDNANNIALRTV
jgi:hypothetical protein